MRGSILCLGVLMGLFGLNGTVKAQYELDEMTLHAGAGLAMFTGQNALGAGAHLGYAYTFYPCGKAFGFEGRANLQFAQGSVQDMNKLMDRMDLGSGWVGWAGPSLGAAFKVRLHDYHRPKEFAFVIGPKVYFPLLPLYNSDLGTKVIPSSLLKVNKVAPSAFFGIQFRRPAPEKHSWLIEPGVEFTPFPLFEPATSPAMNQFYFYLQIGYAFWDMRG